MNDLVLQQLAIATDAWCDQNLPSDWSVNLPAYLATWEGKFAELIVQECLLCCERVISDPVRQEIDKFEQGGIHCMDEIKHVFGVK